MILLPRRAVLVMPIAMLAGKSADRAAAQASDYPNRPVTFIVPFAPGGVTSLFARVLGQKLEQRLGKPFVVENRPGGGGVTAASAVAHATPDGYTIMMASSTVLAINVTVRKNLPYDPRKDLAPIALLARVPFVLVVNPSLPIQSVADLVKLAKEKPGQLSFGTPGPGTFHHLNAEMFKGIFGLDLVHVPYKGSAPALNDLVGGHIQMMFCDVPPAMSLIESRKNPRARRHHHGARAGGAGHSAARRGRHPRLRHRLLAHRDHHRRTCRSRSSTSSTRNIREIMSDPAVTEALVKDGAHAAGEPVARRDASASSRARSCAGARSSNKPGSRARNRCTRVPLACVTLRRAVAVANRPPRSLCPERQVTKSDAPPREGRARGRNRLARADCVDRSRDAPGLLRYVRKVSAPRTRRVTRGRVDVRS